MVNLTRIYTKTGDTGTTALGDMSRVGKTDSRLQAYADVDETNSVIGVAIAVGGLDADVRALLERIQNDLFDVGADLCTPTSPPDPAMPQLRVDAGYVTFLEGRCDHYNEALTKLRSFILPGGTPGAAFGAPGPYCGPPRRTLHLAGPVRVPRHHEPRHSPVPQPAFRPAVYPGSPRQPRPGRRAVEAGRQPLTEG